MKCCKPMIRKLFEQEKKLKKLKNKQKIFIFVLLVQGLLFTYVPIEMLSGYQI